MTREGHIWSGYLLFNHHIEKKTCQQPDRHKLMKLCHIIYQDYPVCYLY